MAEHTSVWATHQSNAVDAPRGGGQGARLCARRLPELLPPRCPPSATDGVSCALRGAPPTLLIVPPLLPRLRRSTRLRGRLLLAGTVPRPACCCCCCTQEAAAAVTACSTDCCGTLRDTGLASAAAKGSSPGPKGVLGVPRRGVWTSYASSGVQPSGNLATSRLYPHRGVPASSAKWDTKAGPRLLSTLGDKPSPMTPLPPLPPSSCPVQALPPAALPATPG